MWYQNPLNMAREISHRELETSKRVPEPPVSPHMIEQSQNMAPLASHMIPEAPNRAL